MYSLIISALYFYLSFILYKKQNKYKVEIGVFFICGIFFLSKMLLEYKFVMLKSNIVFSNLTSIISIISYITLIILVKRSV